MNKEELIKAGYKEWKHYHFQKLIKDDKGKRYYINIETNYYANEKHICYWVCKFQFQNTYLVNKELCPMFEIEVSELSIEELESYIDELWNFYKNPYYEKFEK